MSLFKRVLSFSKLKEDKVGDVTLIEYKDLVKKYKNKDELDHIIYDNFDKVFNYKGFSFTKFQKLKINTSKFIFEIEEQDDNITINAILQYKILDKSNEQTKPLFEETSQHSKHKIKYVSGVLSNKRGSGKNVMLYLEELSPKLDIGLQPHGKDEETITGLSGYYKNLGYELASDPKLRSRHVMLKKNKINTRVCITYPSTFLIDL